MSKRNHKSKKNRRINTVGSSNWISRQIRGVLLPKLIEDLTNLRNSGLPDHSTCQQIQDVLSGISTRVNSLYEETSDVQYSTLCNNWSDFYGKYSDWNSVGYATDANTSNPNSISSREILTQELNSVNSRIANREREIIKQNHTYDESLSVNNIVDMATLSSSLSVSLPQFDGAVQRVRTQIPNLI